MTPAPASDAGDGARVRAGAVARKRGGGGHPGRPRRLGRGLAEAARAVLWSSRRDRPKRVADPAGDEHDNGRAALEWTLQHDAETALRLVGALSYFWLFHGHFSEGLSWTGRALAAGEAMPAAGRAPALYGASVLATERAATTAAFPGPRRH